ncbi:MAG: DUF4292 domain-containing protein [Sphingobacteriales bacterium]|nr:MAG: DUF4292 domain-containing protein [Sphingobacteriales bacterium]
MRKNISISLCIALLLISATACKTKKLATQTTAKSTSKSPLAKITAAQINFNTFTAKAKTSLQLDGKEYPDVILNIRIKNKETIWVSATAYGLVEVGRVLITPDSIKILNKIQSEITLKPFAFIQKYTSNKIDFATLQAILVGNPMPFVLSPQTQIKTDSSGTILSGNIDNLTYQTNYNQSLNLVSALLSNGFAGQKLVINYAQFTTLAGQVLPTQLSLNSSVSNKNITADMVYSVPEINTPLDFPFNIPKRYSVID